MSRLLGPGMRLMRRLRLPGKLAVVAAVLVLPQLVTMAASFHDARAQITRAERERDGLTYLGPLTRLGAGVASLRESRASGSADTAGVPAAIADVDEADTRIGNDLGTRADWRAARAALTDLVRSPPDAVADGPRLADVVKQIRALTETVSARSGLALDPAVDGNHLVVVVADRLPRLLDAVGTAQALDPGVPGGTPGADVDRSRAIRDMTATKVRIAQDLQSAVAGTGWADLEPAIGPHATALDAAVQKLAARLDAAGGRGGSRAAPSARAVVTAAAALSDSLVRATDSLLSRRTVDLTTAGATPLVLSLLALLVAGYLFLALYRSTTRDARHVLQDIDTVTAGALHQTDPLVGADEFARISRTVVVLRDRLTSMLGELRYQATHDDLTALGNRAMFTDRLGEALDGDGDSGRVAVVLVDLDGFKDINDSFGHGTGDRLLRAAGLRFHRVARRHDIVARLGGDEFAVLLTEIEGDDEAMLSVARLQHSLEEPVELDGRRLRLRASVGVALGEPGRNTAVEVMRNADVALYSAKDAGKGRAVLFEPHMHDRTRERTELSTDLAHAVERDEFVMAYQPIVDLASGRMVGVEALVRWVHPERGVISPAVFVPLAEASGLIRPMGRWVLEEAARQQAHWRQTFGDRQPLSMEVNVSAAQLSDESLVEDILAIISETGIDPTSLVLEITESALVEDVDTVLVRLGQLAATGVRIALDDFGTGYSSLSYLRRMPISILKIDRSFSGGIDEPGSQSAALMRSIIGLATSLGMETIVEGVERDPQAAAVAEFGCRLAQGFLFSRPVPAEEITSLLEREMAPVPAQRGASSPF